MSLETENQENENASAEEQSQEQQVATWNVVDVNSTPTEGVTKLYEQNAEQQETASQESENQESETDETASEQSDSQQQEEVAEEQRIIDEAEVLNFLKGKGFNAETIDDLKPKEGKKITPLMEKYQEYVEETGNESMTDFLSTQKDWKAEPKESVLLQNLKAENPTLTDSQIERLFKRQYEFDAEYDDEDVVLDKQINIEKDYQKGLKLLEDQKDKYMVRRGSDETIPEEFKKAKEFVDNLNKQQEESNVVNEKLRQDFSAKTEQVFSKDFEGFKVKVGDAEFKVKPENVEVAKSTLSDLSNFDKKFFDQTTGELKDPSGYYKALHFAMNPDKVAEHFINIGKAMQAEQDEKESKNIQTQSARGVDNGLESKVKQWNVVNP